MSLTVKDKPYMIPEYSVTGDILSFLRCGLQYRYQNKGALPPSKPVQLWFGEFIHGVMEEAYLRWKTWDEMPELPWDWQKEIRDIELAVSKRLAAGGLRAPRRVFCPFKEPNGLMGPCGDTNHPHKWIASRRAERAINFVGPHLFELISEPEVKLKATRPMPNFVENKSRSNYFGITGIIDVLASSDIKRDENNFILNMLGKTDEGRKLIESFEDNFEIIVDYKGMNRPFLDEEDWTHHRDQVLDYAWLRAKQPKSPPVKIGILFYINELAPSKTDIHEFKNQLQSKTQGPITDVYPTGDDLNKILNWKTKDKIPMLSLDFRLRRAIRIIPIESEIFNDSITRADQVIDEIENSVFKETSGEPIIKAWPKTGDVKTCTACDFKTFCPESKDKRAPSL